MTKKQLPRRTFLRGMGATLALPLLDAMVPAFASTIKQAPAARLHLRAARRDHGRVDARRRSGTSFEFKSILSPLAPWRDKLAIVSGLHHRAADSTAVHSLSPTTWLSGVRPKPTQGVDAYAGISADQFAAKVVGQDTALPSMELGTEDHSSLIGACDRDYGCIYMNNISWHTHTTPLPIEINPRKVFERMFGDGGSVEEQIARRREDRSILDAVSQQTAVAEARARPARIATSSINISKAFARSSVGYKQPRAQVASNKDLVIPEAPPGIPFVYADHVDIMFDLMTLAYQANITRVQTFQMARELSNRTYPQVDVQEGHHAVSHHQNRADKMAMNARIQRYHVGLFSGLLKKLDAVQDGDGTLLDNMMLLYGSNMSNSNAHDHFPLAELRRRRGHGSAQGRPAREVPRSHADDESRADAAAQGRRAARESRRQHGHYRRALAANLTGETCR